MNGVLPVDKPAGFTSHDVVNLLRKKLNIKRVGHAGTLDPDATGLLLMLIGEGTKLSPFLMDLPKEYIARITLGIETDTHDKCGKVLRKGEVNVTESRLKNILLEFVGEQEQIPPQYSAIKYKGKPMYKYAREGCVLSLEPRKVVIKDINVININLPDVELSITCSKGTYIRALARDIGERAGCGAILSELRRTGIGNFRVENALSLDEINHKNLPEIISRIISLNSALAMYSSIVVEDSVKEMIKNARIDYMAELVKSSKNVPGEDLFKFVDKDGHLLAIVKAMENSQIKILRIFNEK